MPYAAAGLMLAIYAMNVPLALAVVWEDRLGFGLSVFNCGKALKRARKVRRSGRKGKLSREYLGAAMELARHARLSRFWVRARIGADDAGTAAKLCAAANAAAGTLCALADESSADICPDFSGGGIYLRAGGIITIRAGRLLPAAGRVLFRKALNRIREED